MVALLLAFLAPVSALAQIADRDAKIEKPDTDARASTDRGSSSKSTYDKDFTLNLDIPLHYASGVASASVESVVDRRPDVYISPELSLKWSHQYPWLYAAAELGVGTDRYQKTKDANLDRMYSTFKLAKTDGKNETFVPYANLTNETYFEPNFRRPDITYQDVAVGFYSGIGWRDRELIPYSDSLINYSDAGDPGDMSIKFDFRVGRRISDYNDYQNTFIASKLSLSYYVNDVWRIETAAKFRARWYESYYDEKRVDYRPGAAVSLVWSPAWLTAMVKRAEISFDFETYRNFSNISDKNITVWEAGPTLSLRTKF